MKSKKRWFDDWEVTYKGDGEAIVNFPHSVGYKRIVFTKSVVDIPYVKWLIDLVDCLATELTSKK